MSHNRVLQYTLVACAVLGVSLGAQAQSLQAQAQAQAAANAAAAAGNGVVNVQSTVGQALPGNEPQAVQSTVDDLQAQIQSHALTEMRTAYNGSFGASLLLNIKEGTYYVALFHQKAFWRVIKTTNEERAEAVYANFSKQAESLSAGELQAAKLESEKTIADQQIALVQDRATRLQADLQIAHDQQASVAKHQREVRAETAALKAQKDALQNQLRQLQERVRQLQSQANAGLQSSK